jgi:hypothetical protein
MKLVKSGCVKTPTDESSHMIRNPLHPWDQYLIRGNYFFSSPHISTPCSSGRSSRRSAMDKDSRAPVRSFLCQSIEAFPARGDWRDDTLGRSNGRVTSY